MPGFIGVPELILLGLVVLLVFGPKRLPEMGRSLGRGMKEFKDSVTGDSRAAREDEKETKDVALPAGGSTVALAVPTREREDVA